MSDRSQLLERFIQLEALSRVVDHITNGVFDDAVEGDWSKFSYRPIGYEELRPLGYDEEEYHFASVRADLVAAQMFAELSVASEWFREQARHYTNLANRRILEDVGGD